MVKIEATEKVTPNFKVGELACKDGNINSKVILICKDYLQPLREKAGVPFSLTSAYRTEAYNKSIGGSPNSQHMLGKAFDIVWTVALKKKFGTQEAFKKFCIENGVKGFGHYKTFVHIDWRITPNSRGWSEWDER